MYNAALNVVPVLTPISKWLASLKLTRLFKRCLILGVVWPSRFNISGVNLDNSA